MTERQEIRVQTQRSTMSLLFPAYNTTVFRLLPDLFFPRKLQRNPFPCPSPVARQPVADRQKSSGGLVTNINLVPKFPPRTWRHL